MDKFGRFKFFKWRINIIDFFASVCSLGIVSLGFLAHSIWTAPEDERLISPSTQVYVIRKPCPNCGSSQVVDEIKGKIDGVKVEGIMKGNPVPEYYEKICCLCQNKVVLIINQASKNDYILINLCPICREEIECKVKKGEILPNDYKTICPSCENQVTIFEAYPDEDPEKEYYRRALEKGLP